MWVKRRGGGEKLVLAAGRRVAGVRRILRVLVVVVMAWKESGSEGQSEPYVLFWDSPRPLALIQTAQSKPAAAAA